MRIVSEDGGEAGGYPNTSTGGTRGAATRTVVLFERRDRLVHPTMPSFVTSRPEPVIKNCRPCVLLITSSTGSP